MGFGEGHEEAHHFRLAGGSGFVEHGFDLLADGSDGDAAEGGYLVGGVGHEEAVCDFGLGCGEVVEGAEDVIREVGGVFGVGDEEEYVGIGIDALAEGCGAGEELEWLFAGGSREAEGAVGLGGGEGEFVCGDGLEQMREVGFGVGFGGGELIVQ